MKLREIRKEQRLTVPELSRLAGVPVRTIEEIERRNQCTVANAKKLSQVLGVSLDELCAD